MKNISILMFLCVALAGVGCSTLRNNETQMQVLGQAGRLGIRAAVSAADIAAVKQIVTELGPKWRLQERTTTSFIPTVIASYSQDWNHYPLSLVAFLHEGKIVVHLTQPSTGVGETALYRARQEELIRVLHEKFGDRAVMPHYSEWVRHVTSPGQ